MHSIKIHLDPAEYAVVCRFATALKVEPADVAFAALDRIMQQSADPAVRSAILETRNWRGDNLPTWADTERSVHAYEGSADDPPVQRLQF